MRSTMRLVFAFALAILGCALPAHAGFHLMQIEQVIAGVNGDQTAQAIQLRMRQGGQNFTNGVKIRAWDANGANPVIIYQFTSGVVNGLAGDRILITSASFNALTSPPTINDRTMTNVIPASYIPAGKLTFESSIGQIYWAVAWGGYTGPNTGIAGAGGNDADGQFSPAFSQPLPTAGASALQFDGLFGDLSTTNAADYIITAGSSTWVNNGRSSFVLAGAPSGQCCLTGGACQVSTQAVCNGLGGTWTLGGTCPVGACPGLTGACCDGASCSVMTSFSCGLMGGSYQGDGTSCSVGSPTNFVVCCRANFDQQNGVDVPDIFAFLSAWFANDASADIDGTPGIQVPDIFAFLSLWFAGCS